MNTNQPQKINRINYIVQENPKGVAKLLRSEGIEVPQHLQGLILTTKKWVSKEGKTAILKLLQEHPEKDLLLNLNQQAQFENYSGCGCKSSFTGGDCGCKSSYSGNVKLVKAMKGKEPQCKRCQANAKAMTRQELWEGLEEMRPEELKTFYSDMKRAAKEQPNNQRIKEELEIAWEFMRSRNSTFKTPADTIIHQIAPQITPPPTKEIPKEANTNQTKIKKHKGNSTLFTVSTKEFAITGIVLGVTLLIVQFKS